MVSQLQNVLSVGTLNYAADGIKMIGASSLKMISMEPASIRERRQPARKVKN